MSQCKGFIDNMIRLAEEEVVPLPADKLKSYRNRFEQGTYADLLVEFDRATQADS